MSIAMRLSATATLGNCRMLFMCDYVFSEHKCLDNVNWILLGMKGILIEDKLVFYKVGLQQIANKTKFIRSGLESESQQRY